MKFEWEDVESPCQGDYTERLKVFGGWLVRTILKIKEHECVSMVFVPDANHEWSIK